MYCNRCASNDALQYLSSSRLSRTVRKIKTNQIYQISHYLQFLQLSQYHNILLLPRYLSFILSEFRIAFKNRYFISWAIYSLIEYIILYLEANLMISTKLDEMIGKEHRQKEG